MAGFSEIQFSYSVIREIEDRLVFGNVGIPFIPSTRDEGSLGYDVRFDGPVSAYFLQFKIPEYLHKRSANEWDLFNKSYFRFSLYPDNISKQHNLLVNLAEEPRNSVYYCAPGFVKSSEYEMLHRSRSVSAHSAFISVKGLDRIKDGEKHVIVYRITPLKCYMMSEPAEINSVQGWGSLLEHSLRFDYFYNSIEHFAEETWRLLREVSPKEDLVLLGEENNKLKSITEYLISKNIAFLLIKE